MNEEYQKIKEETYNEIIKTLYSTLNTKNNYKMKIYQNVIKQSNASSEI